jgi:hypothetical protein
MTAHNPFEPLEPLLGKTWRGEFANSTPEKPVIDVSRWELALNGKAIRILHSINDGEYGGETIVVWDEKAGGLIYFYFTTAGFYTQGQMSIDDGRVISHELVSGNQNGITEVKAVSEILPDGRMRVRSEYLQNGEWKHGRETVYTETTDAEVKFKPAG